jgi:threonine/homoserine/homoserine lactone efflux protein
VETTRPIAWRPERGEVFSRALAGFGLGVALAGAPGPVQAVLMGEAIRGGIARGFRALLGANVTFGLLLLSLALGLSVASPRGVALRILKVAGGAFLVWMGMEGIRSSRQGAGASAEGRALPPAARGSLAVLLNPGAWLFLGAVASPLFASASVVAGTGGAVLAAVGLVIGLAIGDGAVVLMGGIGVRRAGERVARWVGRALASILIGVGAWFLIAELIS